MPVPGLQQQGAEKQVNSASYQAAKNRNPASHALQPVVVQASLIALLIIWENKTGTSTFLGQAKLKCLRADVISAGKALFMG